MRQRNMQTTTNAQMGLLNSLMIATPTNEFLERLDLTMDWEVKWSFWRGIGVAVLLLAIV